MTESITADVLALWSDVELLERASGGWVNEVHFGRVNGTECVVRASKKGDAALMWELDLLADVTRHGLAAPEVIETTDGERQIGAVVLFRRITGSPPSTSDEWRLVAAYLEALHELGAGRTQRPGFLSAVDLVHADTGGRIDLTHMPAEAVTRCRAAWARLESLPRTVIHGDPGSQNIFIEGDRVVLIDWDEARVDCPWFDLAALPDEACPIDGEELWIARQASNAWEAAISWGSDRPYAEWRLSEVGTSGGTAG